MVEIADIGEGLPISFSQAPSEVSDADSCRKGGSEASHGDRVYRGNE